MFTILKGQEVEKALKNLVYAKKQVQTWSVDLTVKSISKIATAGSVDFGGSEFSPGERKKLIPKKLDPDDKYGWWFLQAGDYVLEYNEKLSLGPDKIAVVQPHERLLDIGVTHSTRFITEAGEKMMALIHVTSAEARIKENARVSKLMACRMG